MSLKNIIKIKRFDDTSSTQLELKNLLWALSNKNCANHKIIVYTDSQNIINLPDRRHKLEQKGYISNNNTYLKNYKLYQEFYRLVDLMDCTFIKIKGHVPTNQKKKIDRLFSLVDKASRNAMRDKSKVDKLNK